MCLVRECDVVGAQCVHTLLAVPDGVMQVTSVNVAVWTSQLEPSIVTCSKKIKSIRYATKQLYNNNKKDLKQFLKK
jgi:hypothetical protein